MNNFITNPLTLLVLHLLFLVSFFLLLIIVLKKLFKRKEPLSLTEVSWNQPKLIAIGVTAYFFEKTFNYLAVYPISICITNINSLFKQIIAYQELLASATNEKQVKSPIVDVDFISDQISHFWENLPVSNLLLAIAFSIIVYKVTKYIWIQINAIETPAAVPQKANAIFYNLSIVLIMVISLFLVICVFISIPLLNDLKKPTIFSRAQLDSNLNNVMRLADTNSLKKEFPLTPPPFSAISIADSLFKNQDTLNTIYRKMNGDRKITIDNIVKELNNQIKISVENRKELISEIEKAFKDFLAGTTIGKQKLSSEYQENSLNIFVDKDLLYTNSLTTYEDYIQNYPRLIAYARNYLKESDKTNSEEYSYGLKRLGERIIQVADTSVILGDYPSIALDYSNYQYEPLSYYSNFSFDIEPPKKDWGIFGVMSGFLLKTKSLDLVLLIGMLGFGLLGASLSSFQKITPPTADDNNQTELFFQSFKSKPIIKNFWEVLLRGFSAAIVIYLATKGGVAILTSNLDADPNGYVLLLLCFISAIFSEKVWENVKSRYKL